MGHNIDAIITAQKPVNPEQFDLPVFHENGYFIIGLIDYHSDFWAEKLEIPFETYSDVLLDDATTKFFIRKMQIDQCIIINTNYFGGVGDQSAVFYNNNVNQPTDNINTALKMIGVIKGEHYDEFEAINLQNHRNFDDDFEKYWDS